MTITAATLPLLDRLLPLPLDQLILHEQLEPARLRAVLRNLVRTKVQNNPVLVTRLPDDRWLVIDGAHRVSALRRLGVTQVLTQVISAGEYRISAWHHLIAGAPPFAELDALLAAGCPDCDRSDPSKTCFAIVRYARRIRHACADADVATTARRMNDLADWHAGCGRFQRLGAEERAPGRLGARQVRIEYRPWTLSALRELTADNLLLPAGVTRFIVPGRVLGVAVPLGLLSAADSEGEIRQRLATRNFRYYAEPVYIAE